MARESNPQWADDREFIESFVRHHRLTSSPGTWLEFRRMTIDLDVTDVLSAIRVPTLVMAKERTRTPGAEVAERIKDSQLAILPGEGLAIFENEFAIEAIEAFLAGAPQQMIPDRVLVTLLFTDLVGSTESAAELGDRRWSDLLSSHHEIVRRELTRFRGVEIDTAGDGFFATFDGPARAIHAARRSSPGSTGSAPRACRRAHGGVRATRREGGRHRSLDRRACHGRRRPGRGAGFQHGQGSCRGIRDRVR